MKFCMIPHPTFINYNFWTGKFSILAKTLAHGEYETEVAASSLVKSRSRVEQLNWQRSGHFWTLRLVASPVGRCTFKWVRLREIRQKSQVSERQETLGTSKR